MSGGQGPFLADTTLFGLSSCFWTLTAGCVAFVLLPQSPRPHIPLLSLPTSRPGQISFLGSSPADPLPTGQALKVSFLSSEPLFQQHIQRISCPVGPTHPWMGFTHPSSPPCLTRGDGTSPCKDTQDQALVGEGGICPRSQRPSTQVSNCAEQMS